MDGTDIPGYTYGTTAVPKSPVTLEELAKLEQAVGLTDDDRRYFRLAGDVLEDQAEAVVDCWRGIIGQQPSPPDSRLLANSREAKAAAEPLNE